MPFVLQTGLTGTRTFTIPSQGDKIASVAYWIGIRTPATGTGITARMDALDTLGFLSSSAAAPIDSGLPGSSQGVFCLQSSDGNDASFVIEVLGAGDPEYDFWYNCHWWN